MSRRNLHELPRLADGWTFLYVDKAKVEREQNGLRIVNELGRILVPVSNLSALMLGPGTTITHAAVILAGDSGCSVGWCGDEAVRFYASGAGDDRRCDNLLHQAAQWADQDARLEVVKRMYAMRFNYALPENLTIEQIRGKEGVRVRQTYAAMAKETGIKWTGRAYARGSWSSADAVNRALSAANSCLHAVVHCGVNLAGYNEHIGFVHTGKSRAFVYDIADLYKAEITIPLAFRCAAEGDVGLESKVRRRCRDLFYESKLLERIVPDIQRSLGQRPSPVAVFHTQDLEARQLGLWDPRAGEIAGGRSFANDNSREDDDDADEVS